MKGLSNKQPKIVAACISVLRRGIQWVILHVSIYLYYVSIYIFNREFGARVFNIKQLLKSIPGMFEHSDKTVRAEVSVI